MKHDLPDKVTLIEVGPRDGFQFEKQMIPTEMKVEIINDLVEAGLKHIQVASFVNPARVPQMADAEEVVSRLPESPGVIFSGLVLNPKGLQRALRAGLKHVEISISASDTHSRKNTNASLPEARQRIAQMIKIGKKHGLTIRGELQCVFGCRFEGRVDPKVVFDMIKEQLDLGDRKRSCRERV